MTAHEYLLHDVVHLRLDVGIHISRAVYAENCAAAVDALEQTKATRQLAAAHRRAATAHRDLSAALSDLADLLTGLRGVE